MKIINRLTLVLISSLLIWSCTDLEPEVLNGVLLEDAADFYAVNDEDAATLLRTAYDAQIFRFVGNTRRMLVDELSTDAMVIPARGSEWDDGGRWRIWHIHAFDANNPDFRNLYNQIYAHINRANLVIGSSNVTEDQVREARFLRAIGAFYAVDWWGKLLFRDVGSSTREPAQVLSRTEATDWLINELEEIIPGLPQGGSGVSSTLATKNAANYYLALLYLNYGVYTGDPANPTFDPTDMDKVIAAVDAIQGVTMENDYYNNFRPENDEISTELIYTIPGNPFNRREVTHWYRDAVGFNQANGGWNGMSTTEDFFDAFDGRDNDPRSNYRDPDIFEQYFHNLGFLQGEQYTPPYAAADFDDLSTEDSEFLASRIFFTDYNNQEGEIRDEEGGFLLHAGRSEGVPLNFTREINLVTNSIEGLAEGYRGVKYVPDPTNYDRPRTNFVMARYGGALTMKAEAQARKGDLGGATATVQQLPNETTTVISAVEDMLDVRARELWWEMKRRNDLIRFGKYLEPRLLKPNVSDPRYLLMPIPEVAVNGNPNLTQNPGY